MRHGLCTPRYAPILLLLLALCLVLPPGAAYGQGPLPPAAGAFLQQRLRDPAALPYQPSEVSAQSYLRWQIWTVDSGLGETGGEISLQLDAAGRPHISYCSLEMGLRYVRHDGTAWRAETVDPGRGNGRYTSLALDAAGQPHISFAKPAQGLMYARRSSSGWQIEAVDPAARIGNYTSTSIAIDRAGRPHIAYADCVSEILKYAYRDGSGWHIQTVDSGLGYLSIRVSLALDSQGRPRIAYTDSTLWKHKYAQFDGASWRTEKVLDRAAGELTLRLDANDRPHIVCGDENSDVRYLYWDGTAWQVQWIARGGGPHGSLALTRGGQPRMAYIYPWGSAGTVNYVFHNGTDWQSDLLAPYIVESSPPTGRLSLALNEWEQPRVAYVSGQKLYYAAPASDMRAWSQLTFSSFLGDNWDIYTAAGDGAAPIRRTYDPATETNPAFNRGATRIAFVSRRDGNAQIYTMNADGSNLARRTWTGASELLPKWSPDGSQIAFYSNRDGNYEVYVMDADGANQRRLTAHAAWDGQPAWSPDGAQIVFVSERTGEAELWVMNADGSAQRPLSHGLVSAAYPAWSPDGKLIAFNRDANADGWLDLALVNADGSGLTYPLGNSPGSYDYLGPAWSPDGESLAFSKVNWISYQGEWYWVSANILATDLASGHIYTLTGSGRDWWPDWQTSDVWAPASAVAALPALSESASFTVRWSGSDTGVAGLRSYDVQHRDGAGAWVDWQEDTTETSAAFTGAQGHTYAFRSRARDWAGNLEPWPAAPDAVTTVYRGTLGGRVLGNRDQPVAVAAIQATPAALGTALSTASGAFTLYLGAEGPYSLSVSRAGFGSLPAMRGVGATDTPTFYLPPADDCLADGGFEAGDLAAWHPSGEVTAVLTQTAHTGNLALALGPWQSRVEQQVTAPASATLSLLYRVVAADPAEDSLSVTLTGNGQTVRHALPLTAEGWAHAWFDVPAELGAQLTVRIQLEPGGRVRPASVLVDEVSLGTAAVGGYRRYLPVAAQDHR